MTYIIWFWAGHIPLCSHMERKERAEDWGSTSDGASAENLKDINVGREVTAPLNNATDPLPWEVKPGNLIAQCIRLRIIKLSTSDNVFRHEKLIWCKIWKLHIIIYIYFGNTRLRKIMIKIRITFFLLIRFS